MERQTLTVKEVANYLGVHTDTIYAMVHGKQIPHLKIGNRILFTNKGCSMIYKDKFTGTKKERPEFVKLLEELRQGDTLVVTKLDRFAQSTADGINTVKELFERGVKVHVLNMGLVEDTPTGRLILSVMLAFAEFETDMIVERTREGKAIAKQKPDFRGGRPKKFSKKHMEDALSLLKNHSYKEVEECTVILKSILIREKKEKGLL
ncbi:recombinase family protein [Virgibacillus necropolis]|uniref:recombinase family protein n=1 Tax=Virgibacillus necropolis TaxID=163877 RepID=UPI001269E56F|nr:recombinase family protein [Virgibacillus necropolis]